MTKAYAPSATQSQQNFTHRVYVHFYAAGMADVVHLSLQTDTFRSVFVSIRVNSCAEGDCTLCKVDSLFASEAANTTER